MKSAFHLRSLQSREVKLLHESEKCSSKFHINSSDEIARGNKFARGSWFRIVSEKTGDNNKQPINDRSWIKKDYRKLRSTLHEHKDKMKALEVERLLDLFSTLFYKKTWFWRYFKFE